MQRIEFIYKLGSQEPIHVWEKIELLLKNLGESCPLILYGKKVAASKLSAEIKKRKGSFNVEYGGFVFHMATVTNYNHVLLQIDSKEHPEEWWACWVSELIKLQGFIQAWLVDAEFNYWQNATDPIQYKSKGRSYEGLPMISNGLPPPLEQLKIDISKNLGLRKICYGYVEAIGAIMWLSEDFLDLNKRSIEWISKNSGARVEQVSEGVYELMVSRRLFCDGTSLDEQMKLRQAIYR